MSADRARSYPQFDAEKAVAAAGYLVEHTNETLYPIMKMLYLADKVHLERYGRLIAGDTHCAMEQGPVPSCTYNLLKHVRGESQDCPGTELAERVFIYGLNHQLSLREKPDYDELSQSDVECLDAVVDLWRRYGKWAIRDLSHDDAWKVTYEKLGFGRKSMPMSLEDIARQFDDDAALEHVRDPHPGEA